MKKFFLLVTAFIFSLTTIAQVSKSNNGKAKDKSKNKKSADQGNSEQHEKDAKEKKEKDEHSKKVWEGTLYNSDNSQKFSKNQPAKVRAAFQRDYPNARNVSWSKYRGDWTASFGNGLFMSTALYHANGERRDTRTPVTRNEMPRNVLDSIFKRRPGSRLEDIIKIEVPNVVKDIFRIKDNIQGKPTYFYYNKDGQVVKYDY